MTELSVRKAFVDPMFVVGRVPIAGVKFRLARDFCVPSFAGDEGRSQLPPALRMLAKRHPLLSKTVLSALLIVSLVSCSSEDERLHEQMKEVFLWSASAEMILDMRLNALVPEGFTDLAVQRCEKQIADISSQLPHTSRYGPARAAAVKLNGLIAAAHNEIDHDRLEQGRWHLVELHHYEREQRKVFGADG